MKSTISIFTACLFTLTLSAQQTTQERLGYSKDTKLLIIHGDDLGVSHSQNTATENAMEKGSVSSGAIMVPTPWFSEIAAYVVAHPKGDFGLHMTLTSEWKYYKWGPVSMKASVPGLVNEHGFFYSSNDSIYKTATVDEVEKELRAQIEKAKKFGVDITHLDSHMGTLYANPQYFQVLLKLGTEYKVPVMIPALLAGAVTDKNAVIMGGMYGASPDDFKKGAMAAYYTNAIKSIQPGLNIIIIHDAYDNEEMQAVTVDHPDWGAAWRQADNDFFTSEQCKNLLKEQNIHVITWREVRDKLYR